MIKNYLILILVLIFSAFQNCSQTNFKSSTEQPSIVANSEDPTVTETEIPTVPEISSDPTIISVVTPESGPDPFGCSQSISSEFTERRTFPANLPNAICFSQTARGSYSRQFPDLTSKHRLNFLANFNGTITYFGQPDATGIVEFKLNTPESLLLTYERNPDAFMLSSNNGKAHLIMPQTIGYSPGDTLKFNLFNGQKLNGLIGLSNYMSAQGKHYRFNTIPSPAQLTGDTKTFAGTLGDDVIDSIGLSQFQPGYTNNFAFLKNPTIRGGGGNDTYFFRLPFPDNISDRTTVIVDTEGYDVIHLIDLNAAGANYQCINSALQITTSGNNKIQILGGSRFLFKLDHEMSTISWSTLQSRLGFICN